MTTEHTLTDSWIRIATDSTLVQMLEGLNVWLSACEEEPGPEATPHILLTIKNPRYPYPGKANLYARLAPNSSEIRTRISVTSTAKFNSVSLKPNAYIDFPPLSDGHGFVQLADNEAWAQLAWGGKSGLVLLNNSANVSLTDGANRLYVEYAEDRVRITNRFSEVKTITMSLNYR